jgi:hypothetical protein
MTDKTLTRSQIFSQYNKARAAARKGKLDEARTNRALGILLSKPENVHQYVTTCGSCNCPDRINHPKVACKHMISKMISVRASQNRPTPQPTPKLAPVETSPWYETSDGTILVAEQKKGSYDLHEFNDIEQGRRWAATTAHGALVRPSKATGHRGYNIDHTLEE